MKPTLLEHLRCLQCQKSFELVNAKRDGDEIESGRLNCSFCQVSHEIRGGVPRFVKTDIESVKVQTAVRFGAEWNYFGELNSAYENDLLKEFIFPATPEV